MSDARKLWTVLGVLLVVSFGVLLWSGSRIHEAAPPMPDLVVSEEGTTIYTRAEIERGRQVWQSIGGMQLGSIWGHGGYVAPDWSADWLHREAEALANRWALAETGIPFGELDADTQGAYKARLRQRLRPNTFDAGTGRLVISDERAAAMREVAAHYEALFGNDPALESLRENYAMKNNTVPDPAHREALTAFFFWTAWAAVTERPGSEVTYTNNWPADDLVGNAPTSSTFIWTVFSVLFLIAGIALLAWYHALHGREEAPPRPPASDPLSLIKVTPSMRATAKYFWLVVALFLVQIGLGAITAHYQVEGHEFYGFTLSEILPYSLTRTWHTQLAVLWIATAWLGTGLYIAPAVSGHEARGQRAGVSSLLAAPLVRVVGAFAGRWFAVRQKRGLAPSFWFGHQGWEYTDIGRFWQAFLFVGLMLWLVLVGRALWPAMKGGAEL